MLEPVNQVRAVGRTCGTLGGFASTTALDLAAPLTAAAAAHADVLATTGCFSHDATGSQPCDDGTPCTRAASQGYLWDEIAENIAKGQPTVAEAMAAWLTSPDHCSNLMNPAFANMGAATAVSSTGDAIYVIVFGQPGDHGLASCQ